MNFLNHHDQIKFQIKLLLSFIVNFVILFFSTTTFAQTANSENQNTPSSNSAFNAASIDAAMNSASTASTASGGQGAGSMMNFAGSAMMAATGAYYLNKQPSPDKPMAEFFFIQAGLAAAQAGLQSLTSGGNKGTSRQFLTNPDSYSGSSTQNQKGNLNAINDKTNLDQTNDSTGGPKGFNGVSNLNTASQLPEGAQSVLDKLNKNGYKVDINAGTITTPDGKSISMSDASNPAKAEAKLGLPSGTYSKGMEIVNEMYKKNGFGSPNMADTFSGGAGVSGTTADGSTEGYDGSGGAGKGNGDQTTDLNKRAPASSLVAGLTTKYQGENIGVAADDIFSMVTRRYTLKNQQDSFITADRPEKGVLGESGWVSPKK